MDSNGSQGDGRKVTVLTAPSSQDISVNSDPNNDNNNDNSNNINNNNSKNLTDIRFEFEALRTFFMEELYHLRQQVKKLKMEEVNSGKERYHDFLPNHLQSEINYLRDGNEHKN